jgi:hypothetical protein
MELPSRYNFALKRKLRGAWLVLLVNAYLETPKNNLYMCGQIRRLQEYFPCAECKQHFGEYIQQHPPELAKRGELFLWVVMCMNDVQWRLHRPLYDYEHLRRQFASNDLSSIDPLYDYSNPHKLKGAWLVLLCNSCSVDTPREAQLFCSQVRDLQYYLPIVDEQDFLGNYLLTHPPEEQIDTVLGMFIWTVDYLNARQRYHHKPEYERYLLYRQFNEPGWNTCHECGG